MSWVRRAMIGVLAIVAVLVSAGGAARAQPAMNATAVHGFIEVQLARHRFPGVAVALIDQGQIIDVAGFGTAGHGRPMTADTPMEIGSMSKMFTAVAVLQLVEHGAMGLDAPVRSYLPWFSVADQSATEAITVRHLLNHTRGLSEASYQDAMTLPPETSTQDAMRALASASVAAAPGTAYEYFNPGYQVLALIIEQQSGVRYPDYLQANVFAPLGMSRSSGDPADTVRADLAQGHSKLFGFPVSREVRVHHYFMGSGSVTSTARDMGRFLAALQNEGELDGIRILASDSVRAMRRPPDAVPTSGYGFGWEVGQENGMQIGEHNGAAATFMGTAVLLPDSGRGYVLLTNQEHLLDWQFGFAELNTGVRNLMAGQAAAADDNSSGGISSVAVGLGMLSVLLVVLALLVRSLLRLRGWRDRVRALPPGRLIREAASHFVFSVIVLIAVYLLAPTLFGRPWLDSCDRRRASSRVPRTAMEPVLLPAPCATGRGPIPFGGRRWVLLGAGMPDLRVAAPQGSMPIYLAVPTGPGPWPGVVVIHDFTGMSADLRNQANWLASAGFLAVAPDLYYWGSRLSCLWTIMGDLGRRSGRTFDDIEVARAWTAGHDDCTGRVGIIGFCMGGGYAVALAPATGWSASAVNYGGCPKDAEIWLQDSCPIVGSFGGADKSPLGGKAGRRLERVLTDLGVEHDVKIYPGVGHGFMNDHDPADQTPLLKLLARVSGTRYDDAATADARRRIAAFFDTHLRHHAL